MKFDQQVLILKKDGEADKRLADLRIKTLEEIIAGQAAQIASLQKQLDQVKQQVQEIALQGKCTDFCVSSRSPLLFLPASRWRACPLT